MHQIALHQSAHVRILSNQSLSGVITHIRLNYYELECIRLALIGLSEGIQSGVLSKSLTDIPLSSLNAKLRYLNHWLHKPKLRSQLRLDGSNSVLWPLTSSELVDWLLLVCQSCINANAILIATFEVIGSEYTAYSDIYLENEIVSSNFSAFQHYYNDIVAVYQPILIDKLVDIQKQDYPLYPNFTRFN